jgi:hypothetical protein
MLRIITLAMALLAIPATVANVNASYCDQIAEIATARLRAAPAHANDSAPHSDESCRAYSNYFFEAVKARQTASICENSVERQRALDMLDSEIDAFNNLIASQCGEP